MTYVQRQWDFRVRVYEVEGDAWEATVEPSGMSQDEDPPVSCSAMDLATLLEVLVPYLRAECASDPFGLIGPHEHGFGSRGAVAGCDCSACAP